MKFKSLWVKTALLDTPLSLLLQLLPYQALLRGSNPIETPDAREESYENKNILLFPPIFTPINLYEIILY